MSNLDTGNVLGIFAFLVSIGGVIYTAINHKRFRLKCCGKDIDVSVDVEDTTKKPGVVATTESGEKAPATAPTLATTSKQSIQVSKKQNDEDEEEEEEEEYVDRRKQNIRENERNEALKAQYALRVANARKYNQNRRVAPLPPLLPP
jgi:hypothetical protein